MEPNARLVQGLLTVKVARVEGGQSFMVALSRDGKSDVVEISFIIRSYLLY